MPQTPLTPLTPLMPGGQPVRAPRSIYAPDTTPTLRQSPFADQTPGGPFAQTRPTSTAAPLAPPGTAVSVAMPNVQVDNSSPEAFIRSVTPAAKWVEAQTGIPAEAMIGMAANETGYGKYAAGNNLFGIKGTGPAGSTNAGTWEDYGQGPVQIRDNFRAYNSAAQSFQDFADLIQNAPRYAKALGQDTVEGFVGALKAGGYMTDPNYVGKISSIVDRWRPTIDQAAGAAIPTAAPLTVQGRASSATGRPSSTALNQSQFGDKQLTTDEAYVACGPAAAVRFAQAYGRNPTLREATDLASSVGWSAQQGMAGIGSEQKLLARMGIDTRLVPGAQWDDFAHEATTGNPVVISTAGHYFYADGYNPQTGAFHVGRSGMDLRQGKEWMTPAEMTGVMGPVQGALFASNPTIPSPSTASSPDVQLNQTRTLISDSLSGRSVRRTTTTVAPPTPQVADFGLSADPQVQELDTAVQQAASPPEPQKPGLVPFAPAMLGAPPTGGAGGNPFDAIGQTISNAIRSALGGGSGPKYLPGDRPEDQPLLGNRRVAYDENAPPFDPSIPLDLPAGALQDTSGTFANRSRSAIDRFERPFGEQGPSLNQVTGFYTSPPRDVREAADRAVADIQRRGVPTIGPGGGLGVLQPGRSWRELNPLSQGSDPAALEETLAQVPGVLSGHPGEILAEVLARITGGGLEGAAARLGPETGGLARAAETAVRAGERGGILASNVPSSPLSPSSSIQRMAQQGQQSIAASLERNGIQRGWDTFVRAYSDRNVDLNHISEALQRQLGRPLTDSENIALLARFDPTNQSAMATEMALGPALRNVPQNAQNDLYDLIQHRTDISIAEGLGKQAEQQLLEQGIAPSTEQRLSRALDDWNAAQNAFDEAQATQQAVAAGTRQTRESISTSAAQRRVADAQAQLDAAAEVARQAQADAAREQVLSAPGARVVTNAEQRDLLIAENNAKRLNQRYERLFGTNPDNPYLETLGRQVGRAEDRAARLRAAIGETSATRETNINARAQSAADVAAARPTVTPTAQYAGANVRLRYEQQNLERLQTAQARGQQGLTDAVARAEKRVKQASADVQQAQQDLPAAARAQGFAVTTGRQFEGGRTYDDIQQQLAELEQKYANQPETWQQLQDAAQAVFDYRKQLLQEKVDAGIITQQTADDLLATYKEWTPTRMIDYLSEDRPGGVARGNRVNVNSNGFKSYTLEGSQKERLNHVAALINEADQTYAGAAKNRLFNALVNAQGGEGGVLKKIADTVQEYEAAGGAQGALLHPDYTLLPGRGEFKITGFVNGKKQEYITDNPTIKAAVDTVSVAPDPVTRVAGLLTSGVRETAVSRNPVWLAGNAISDAAGYAMGTTAAGGLRRNLPSMALNLAPALITARSTSPDDPNRGQKIAGAAVAGIATRALLGNNLGLGPSAMREFMLAYGDVLKGLGSGRMTGEGVRELNLAGAGMRGGTYYGTGPKAADQRLAQLTRPNAVNPFSIRTPGDAKKLLNDAAAFGWVKALGERFEQAPRLAAYRAAKQRGETQLEAMARARDVTIDFDRGGNFSKTLNHWIPFFNAAAQGGAQFGRLWQRHPGGMALAGISLVGMPTVAAEMWNRSDPQRSQDYDNVPQYLKDQGVVIMLPGDAPVDKDGNRIPQHIDLNLREFAPFAVAAREAFNRVPPEVLNPIIGQHISARGRPQSAGELAGAAGTQLTPLGTRGVLDATFGLVPPPLSTIGQLGLNRDLFRGSTIANQFSDDNASNFGKVVAPLIENAVTSVPGGGAARIRPSQVDFAVRDLFNGLGTTALGAIDTATGRPSRAPGLASDTPVVGSMVGRFVRGTGGQERQDVTAPEAMLAPELRARLRTFGDYWEPSPVQDQIKKVPLRQAEQVEYQRLASQYLDTYLRRVIDNPAFARSQKVRDTLRARAVTAAHDRAAREVLAQVRASGSSLPQRYKMQSAAY